MNETIEKADVTAVVLAGGKGTRLRPFTTVLPKPLVPLGDMSVLEILLRRLSGFGIVDVVISTGYLSEIIMAFVGDGSRFGLKVRYTHEEEPLGTAGPLALVEGLSDTVITMNGDLLTTLNFDALITHHRESGSDITIATYQRKVKIDFGVVDKTDDGAFAGFREKPSYDMDVSMGVNVMSRDAISNIKRGKYLDMPDFILAVRDSGGKIGCFSEECFWLDIGRPDDYAEAQEKFADNRAMFLGDVV